jgi:hypothetical protein
LISTIAKDPTKTLIAQPQTMTSTPHGSDDKDYAKEEKHHSDESWHNPRDA